MTPLRFEAEHGAAWAELEALLDRAEGRTPRKKGEAAWNGARLAALYRAACEQLALAHARRYPLHIAERLELLAQRAHRIIYRRQDMGLSRLGRLVLVDFPQAVRLHRGYLLAAALLFGLPLLAAGWAAWRYPGFILHLMDASEVRGFEQMYGDGAAAFGKERGADTDLAMFGFYIRHNIGIGLQCFAGGIFAGVGSAFYMVFNGLQIGATGGHLIRAGHAGNFLSFVATHAAFELTAIVLAGAAGLRLGHAWLAPGRLTRLQALRQGAHEAVVVVYGVIGMLLVAAALEAFWSSARWLPAPAKYSAAAVCWLLVLAYLGWQGRPARAPAPPAAAAPEQERHAG